MAELLGGGNGPAVSNGNGAATSRPTAPPGQTSSPSRGIRGPRMIMQERAEREARQRAERERLERERQEQEARQLELEEQSRQTIERERAERRAAAGAAGATGSTTNMPSNPQNIDPMTGRRQQQVDPQGRPAAPGMSQMPPGTQMPQQRPARGNMPPQMPAQTFAPGAPPGGVGAGPAGTMPGQAGEPSGAGVGTGARPKNSFPHAFERWEALSAHWEGLTSFWIRQLQQRSEEIDRDPLSQQLARQVTDLSAAGANLFHAVVELQRLRASSERKFQRWFFETRAELERHNEINAMLEASLDEERRGRADAIRDAVEHERANSKTQKQLLEMRKELSISKEEARRAWEELGRREQEERDRTISLQQGLPTIVGGVQVVPMTQGVPSRHGSTRDPRTQQMQPDPMQHQSQEQGGYSPRTPGSGAGMPGMPGPSGGDFGAGYYQQQQQQQHQQQQAAAAAAHEREREASYGAGESEGTYSEEEYETPVSQAATSYPPSSSQQHYSAGPDYSGQGYAAPGWETVPRHHHPTRLSDVIEEEDERSRTSASQVSRG